jgi:glycosyltransferase involved in cell wall biosynthesis
MSEPLITIGITCFNEGDLLAECWQSVLVQTDPRWTAVMVLDGGGGTETREVFQRLEHPRLRKFALDENLGPYGARNRAFEFTQTPLHFYLDGDDLLVPETVERVLQTFRRHPEADFVYGDLELFGERHGCWRYPQDPSSDDFAERQPTPGAAAYTKRMWQELGGFARELSHGNGDYDFLIGGAAARMKGRHCGSVYYRYRTGNPGKVSQSYLLRYHETHEIMVNRHPGFFTSDARRNRFLACGYRRAARANRAAGDARAAAGLARRAMSRGMWTSTEMLRMALLDWPLIGRAILRDSRR